MLKGNILLTGGTGSLGTAILKRALSEQWDCAITVYTRDEMKQQALARELGPAPNVRYAIGDIADYDTLERVMVGHDTVLHAAAFKHIPAGELNVGAMLQTNLVGSQNVITAALRTRVSRVLGISTDKACAPVNAYGASKMLMERAFQEANQAGLTAFHLVRYGNVLDSTGSVLPLWKKQIARGEPITVTDPHMTRFWLGIDRAVQLVLDALRVAPGNILIPQLRGLSMARFAEFVFPDAPVKTIGLRPGEKLHECLLTREETRRSLVAPLNHMPHFVLRAPDAEQLDETDAYTSDTAPEMTRQELLKLLALPVDAVERVEVAA